MPSPADFIFVASGPATAPDSAIDSKLLIGFLCGIVVAGLTAYMKYYFDRKAKLAALRCSATYCKDLLMPSAHGVGNDLEVRVGGHSLTNPAVINYRIECTGNVAVTDVKMRVQAGPGDRIIRWNFYVDQCVQCERLQVVEETTTLLRFNWTYVNPKDAITLVLLVTPCNDANCVTFELDAKEAKITRNNMREDCRVRI